MRTTTSAWQTAAKRTATQGRLSAHREPILLVELLGAGRVFATRRYAPGGPRVAGDGALAGAGLLAGAQWPAAETLLARLDQGGIGALRMDLDESTNTVRLGGASFTLLNQEALAETFTPHLLDNMPVRLRLGFLGLGPSDFLPVFSGVIDRHQITQRGLEVALIDGSLRSAVNLSVPIGEPYFPGAPAASRNQNIPLLLGVNIDAPTIQVSGPASGSLAFALSTGNAELVLTEFGAPFPASGTLSIGGETGVTYARRSLINLQGQTYLRLSGLGRGAPVTHAAGVAVTLTSVQYQYLIGYAVSSLGAVRTNGVVVNPVDYTLTTVQANRPVSVLTFTTQQGTVTADVNAANVDTTNQLTNGGFETGDLTGWTTGAGATAVVGTSAPTPYEGTYRLALTGGLGTYGELWQEFATIPGEDYIVRLAYQDQDGQLLTNGGFETGDLTGWTVEQATNAQATVPLIGQGATPDGQYQLLVRRGQDAPYLYVLSQDVTTSIGQSYVLSFQYKATYVAITAQTQSLALDTLAVSTGYSYFLYSELGYTIGVPGSPASIRPARFQSNPSATLLGVVTNLFLLGIGDFYQPPVAVFVATGTTTRITFLLQGPLATVGPLGTALPGDLALDAVRLQLATVLDTSQSAVQLGTPTTPGLYVDQALLPQYTWGPKTLTFRATEATARLTLRSRFTTSTARASLFDDLQLQRVFTLHSGSGGQNPAEAIAYIITTFTTDTYDPGSFHTAYTQRLAWQFGTVLTNPGDSTALLQRMAQQCHCLLYQESPGTWVLKALDTSSTPVYGFEPSNLTPAGTFTRIPEPLDNVYTDIYVWFGAKTGGSTSASDFAGVTYATPETTTHPTDTTLPLLCRAALALYGRAHRLDVYADMIQDFATANLLLGTTVRRRTVRHDLLTGASWLDAAPLQLGDVVQVQHPTLPNDGAPQLAEVVSIGLTPAQMTIPFTLRTLTPAGWTATFDYAPVVLATAGWSADFESADTVTTGTGWSAHFDPDDVLFAGGRRRANVPWPDEDEILADSPRRSIGVI